jgi:DNA-binding transcriptional LysR family regulator
MNYTLHQLQIFHKIAEKQSITKASEELYLTQPAVSIQLKKFQEQFSIPLTEVIGRKLYLTDFGKEIAEAAEKILNQVEAINYKTMSFKGQVAGRLKIAVVSTGKYVMPYFLSDFMHQHQGVDLSMDVTNKTKVVQDLEDNVVDFAMVSVVPEHLKDKTQRIDFMQNKLYLVGGTKFKGSGKMAASKIFQQKPLLYREEGSATRNAMETYMSKNNYPANKKIELTSNEALKQALIAGLGYSIMPLIGIKNALMNNELEIIPARGLPIVTNWCLIWLNSKQLSPTALAYLDYLREEKLRIINENFSWFEEY